MAPRLRVFSSSVGTKLVIGVTGFLLFLYLLIHIGGNLLVFFGPDVFNRYAYIMEEQNALLPAIELGLLAVVLIHVFKTVGMFFGNQQARPVGYQKKRNAGGTSRKSLASSTRTNSVGMDSSGSRWRSISTSFAACLRCSSGVSA